MAGGQGSRLRPLTNTRPKPMVELLQRPVIEFVKEAMVNADLEEIILTTGYKGEQLENLVSSWNNTGVKSRVNQEMVPMGTAGSVRLLLDELTETFVVGSGDSVTSLNLGEFIRAHRESGAKVTMALWKVDDPTEFGIVGLSETEGGEINGNLSEGFIVKFMEKPKFEEAFSNVINAGLYIIEPEVLALVPEGEKYDFSKQLFPRVLEMGWPMYAKQIDGIWFDVGNPDQLLNAQSVLINKMDSLPFTRPQGELTNGCIVHPNAIVEGTFRNSSIDSDCRLGKGTDLMDSLLMQGVQIGQNSIIKNSVIGRNVTIGDNVKIMHCVIGDEVVIDSNQEYNGKKIP